MSGLQRSVLPEESVLHGVSLQVQADAKKIMAEAQALAEAEIETARAAVQRAEATLNEDPNLADSSVSSYSTLSQGVTTVNIPSRRWLLCGHNLNCSPLELGLQELAALRQEVQEARRIKMLHDSSKVRRGAFIRFVSWELHGYMLIVYTSFR